MTWEWENHIPDWAKRERWIDLAWIGDNLPNFWSAACIPYEVLGCGAMVDEITYRSEEGSHPAAYLTQEQVARYEED